MFHIGSILVQYCTNMAVLLGRQSLLKLQSMAKGKESAGILRAIQKLIKSA